MIEILLSESDPFPIPRHVPSSQTPASHSSLPISAMLKIPNKTSVVDSSAKTSPQLSNQIPCVSQIFRHPCHSFLPSFTDICQRSTRLKCRQNLLVKISIVAFGRLSFGNRMLNISLAYSKRYLELKLTVIQSSHHQNRLLDGLGGGTGGGEGGSPLDIFSGGEEEVTTVRIPFLATEVQLCRRSHNVFSPAPTTTIFPFPCASPLLICSFHERRSSPRRTKKKFRRAKRNVA
jgi:hypothetical protein